MKRRPASPARRTRGVAARRSGRWAEVVAALWLSARGWRILGFRLKTPHGEIDLLARKGEVLAVVEVKARRTMAEALDAVTPAQLERLRRAGESLAANRRDLKPLSVRIDLLALAPGRIPRHIPDPWGFSRGVRTGR
jgi:putative endonuclease